MFNNYKEIVTKAVIGKGKKVFKDEKSIEAPNNVDTVLGCWVINHNISGYKENEHIKIHGEYDVNIWYSYDNNTKTDVISDHIVYDEKVIVRVRDNTNNSDEVIIRSLKNPSCIDIKNENNIINYTISKELGIEIVGDQIIRIPISNSEEEYDVIIDEDEVNKEIDKSVNENYIKE